MASIDPRPRRSSSARAAAWLAVLVVPAILLVPIARAALPATMSPDFICYWTAGEAIAAGRSPYDVGLQARLQHVRGWDKGKDGLGIYDFMPYYYPPWFGALFVAVLPLGFATAKAAWAVVNAELLILTGYLLREATPVVPRYLPMVVVPLFALSVVSVILGQTSPLILFLIVAAWRLLDAGRDRAAGAVLAWLTIKPQLTAVLLLGVLAWAARRRRWGVVGGFAATLAGLALASWLVVPGWLGQMLGATRRTPPPTTYFPWIGTTWFLLLKTAGLGGPTLWVLYGSAALAAVAVVLRAAIDQGRPLRDPIALALLVVFFAAPYGRHYDFPVLLIPFLVLIGTRLPEGAGAALLVALLLLPYLQYGALAPLKGLARTPGKLNPEFTFSWVPLILAAAWWATRRRVSTGGDGRRSELSATVSKG
jgi:hypothetical protein